MYEGMKDATEGAEEGQMQVYQPQGEEQQRQQKQQQWWERQPEALTHPSLVELCFHRKNPTLQAEKYLEIFHQMQGEGLMDRLKTSHILKYWQIMSLIAGSDVFLGMTAKIGEAFDITTADLECTLPLPFRDAQTAAGSVHALTEDLQRCLQFQQEDDGHTPCYMLRMECGLGRGQKGGKEEWIFSCAINKAFQQAFRPALALLDDVVTHRALQSLLFTGIVAHEDRELYMRCIISGLFSRSSVRRSEIFKVYNKDGDIGLYLMQARPCEWPDGRLGALFKLEELPPSRHISPCPHYQKVAQTFRRHPSQLGTGAGQKGEEEANTALTKRPSTSSTLLSLSSFSSPFFPPSLSAVFPGLAAFPLPPLLSPPPSSGIGPALYPSRTLKQETSAIFKVANIQKKQDAGGDGREEEEEKEQEQEKEEEEQEKEGEEEGEERWGEMEGEGSRNWGVPKSSFSISSPCLSLPVEDPCQQQQQEQQQLHHHHQEEEEEGVQQQQQQQQQQHQQIQQQHQHYHKHHQQQQQPRNEHQKPFRTSSALPLSSPSSSSSSSSASSTTSSSSSTSRTLSSFSSSSSSSRPPHASAPSAWEASTIITSLPPFLPPFLYPFPPPRPQNELKTNEGRQGGRAGGWKQKGRSGWERACGKIG